MRLARDTGQNADCATCAPRTATRGPRGLQPPRAALSSGNRAGAAARYCPLGPLARPITRMEPAVARASPLAVLPAADPPPRQTASRNQVIAQASPWYGMRCGGNNR